MLKKYLLLLSTACLFSLQSANAKINFEKHIINALIQTGNQTGVFEHAANKIVNKIYPSLPTTTNSNMTVETIPEMDNNIVEDHNYNEEFTIPNNEEIAIPSNETAYENTNTEEKADDDIIKGLADNPEIPDLQN